MKYNYSEKERIKNMYFGDDNMIKHTLNGMPRFGSKQDKDILENRKLMFELLFMEGEDCIRFAMVKQGECTCKSVMADRDDMINLRDLLLKVFPLEEDN